MVDSGSAAEDVDAMIIVATRASPASRAGSFFSTFLENRRTLHIASQRSTKTQGGLCMPRGRSTFTKRQKEQARQQKQRDKAERRNQRKQEKTEGSVDEMRELREHAEAQAALFRVGSDETNSAESSTADESRDIDQ